MYLNTFGGSALLHLLMGYPRLILMFGLAGIAAMTAAPHGPGRYAGTGAYMAQLDAAYAPRLADAAAEQQARERATQMVERSDRAEIRDAVEYTLRECGAGCTDLATPIVMDDAALLQRVLVLYQLDQAAAARAAAPRTDATDSNVSASY